MVQIFPLICLYNTLVSLFFLHILQRKEDEKLKSMIPRADSNVTCLAVSKLIYQNVIPRE